MSKNYNAFRRKATSCTPDELKILLRNAGEDEKAVDTIREAVNRAFSNEDRGSYCENASQGYNKALKKRNMMDDYDTGMLDLGSPRP